MSELNSQESLRKRLSILVFSVLIISFLYRFLASSLLSQLQNPVFKYPHVDLFYWVFHLLNIPELFTSNKILALLIDLGLFVFAGLSILKPQNNRFPILFSACFIIYFVSYNSYTLHHTHCMIGALFIVIPFWFKKAKTFQLLWEGIRYYTLFIYSSAFLWKLVRGSLFHKPQAEALIKDANLAYLVFNPDSTLSGLIQNLLQNPNLAYVLLLGGFLIQGTFIFGFFTKKFDKVWFVLPFIFHFGTYLLMEVVFFEILVLNIVFLPWVHPKFKFPEAS